MTSAVAEKLRPMEMIQHGQEKYSRRWRQQQAISNDRWLSDGMAERALSGNPTAQLEAKYVQQKKTCQTRH